MSYVQTGAPVCRLTAKNLLPVLLFWLVSYPPPTNMTNVSVVPILTLPIAGSDHVSAIRESVKLHMNEGLVVSVMSRA